MKLESYQRKYLRSRAHSLKPVVRVGQAGLSDAVIQAALAALGDHELIKVRLAGPADKQASAEELAEKTASELCGVVGHTVILYRPHPEEPSIELPVR